MLSIFSHSLKDKGLSIKRVYSSPYRRCLQTAGAVARAAGIGEVYVPLGLGEDTWSIREALELKGLPIAAADNLEGNLYLSPAAQDEALGGGLGRIVCDAPHPVDPSVEDGLLRMAGTIKDIVSDAKAEGDAVLVTHGFAFEALGKHVLVPPQPSLNYREFCCFAVITDAFTLEDAHGVDV